MIEITIIVYLIIVAISAIATALWMIDGDGFDEIDNFWDWVIFNLLWIKIPLKSLYKILFKNWNNE